MIDIDLFAEYLEAHSAKPNTIKSYISNIRFVKERQALLSLGNYHKFINQRRKELGQKSFNLLLTSMKVLLRFIDLYDLDVPEKILKEIKSMRGYSNPIPIQERRAYTHEEVDIILNKTDMYPWRWQAIWTMLSFGIRKSELRQLELTDVNFIENILTVRAELSKSSKLRIIPISLKNKRVIQSWLSTMKPKKYYLEINSSGKMVSSRSLSYWKPVNNKIRFEIKSHNLRYTFATNLYRKTSDIVLVQKMLGHADPSVTSIYLKLTREDFDTKFLEADLSFF